MASQQITIEVGPAGKSKTKKHIGQESYFEKEDGRDLKQRYLCVMIVYMESRGQNFSTVDETLNAVTISTNTKQRNPSPHIIRVCATGHYRSQDFLSCDLSADVKPHVGSRNLRKKQNRELVTD